MSDEDEVEETPKLSPEDALKRAGGVIKELIDLVENLHEFDACRVHGIAPGPHSDSAREAAHEWTPVLEADKFLYEQGMAPHPGKVKRDVGRRREHR